MYEGEECGGEGGGGDGGGAGGAGGKNGVGPVPMVKTPVSCDSN